MKDHACWADGNQALIKKARNEKFEKISQDPSRSINQIYEEVRNSITQTMEVLQASLYKERQELIPPNPKRILTWKSLQVLADGTFWITPAPTCGAILNKEAAIAAYLLKYPGLDIDILCAEVWKIFLP